MAVSMFFGLPGSGKSTLLTSMALKGLRKRSPYKNVYCNVHLNIPGITYITAEDFMVYDISDGLILLDEASVEFNGRLWKQIGKRVMDYFYLHRHARVDIAVFSQANNIDKTIRDVADRCYYIYKPILLGAWFTRYYRIPYTIIIPEKGDTGENAGQIISGYYKPPALTMLFSKWLFRPKYYKYFDSWEFPDLPKLPPDRKYNKPKELHKDNYNIDKLSDYLQLPEELYKKKRAL